MMCEESELAPHIYNHIVQRGAATDQSKSNESQGSASGSQSGSNSRFDFNFEFLKIGSKNKDGERPKKRGPKPDSKPAQTRRQELNRQAQRTHRERKERYVKALEEEVVRLREAFTLITKEKTQILEENRELKRLLEAHGIPYDSQHTNAALSLSSQSAPGVGRFNRSYDDIGIEFVLALEEPCRDHINVLALSAAEHPKSDITGHAMMATYPAEESILHGQVGPENDGKTYDMEPSGLAMLFNLQQRFQLEGEVTPIAVWAMITRHERFAELEMEDFEMLKQELLPKVKCHGFGAIIEDFQVQDALMSLFTRKFNSY